MQHMKANTTGIVVVAAGRGERAGASIEGPKQYRRIGGRPVIVHTLERFLAWKDSGPIIVVIHGDDRALFEEARATLTSDANITTVIGGATRQQSVRAGLQAMKDKNVQHVMIHDAVRPFIDHVTLDRIATMLADGATAVLPAAPVTDTLKRGNLDGTVAETVSRERLYGAQTPQSFDFQTILDAHERAAAENRDYFTDDAAIAEWAGVPVRIAESSSENVKLTTRQDINMADQTLSGQHRMDGALPDVRTGNGYDVHRLEPGDGVWLCGIFIPHHLKLNGHSDADVALHALTDALLATCGAGDIGDHFPPSDPQWKGAASHIFLKHAAEIVRKNGGTIMNADVSLIAEAPKIGPHRQAMREKLAEILSISLERCSVKATTNEQIGFVGRNEGIAAIATATVIYRNDTP